MIIVAGWLRVGQGQRQKYLDGCRPVVEAARRAQGCLDFHLSADPLEGDRINVFERWDDVGSVERFRGSGPEDDQQTDVVDADVVQYEVLAADPLT